jgi:hypothetical protein
MKTKKYLLALIAVIALGTLSFTYSNKSENKTKQATRAESAASTSPVGGIAIEEGI